MIRLAERRYQAVSLFYKEDNEFIISSPPLPTPPNILVLWAGMGKFHNRRDLMGKINIMQS